MNQLIKATVITSAIIVTAVPGSAMASQLKQDMTALGTIAVATAAAGPIGFIAGAVGGAWLAEQVADADEHDAMRVSLDKTTQSLETRKSELASLQQQLASAQREQARFAKMALDQLQLEMLFHTGDSSLTPQGEQRLELLAVFLRANPDLDIQVEGFADPRGEASTNLALSRARAEQVVNQLSGAGVAAKRMTVIAHGETQSSAVAGDRDAYALERVVRIELSRGDSRRDVAGITLPAKPERSK